MGCGINRRDAFSYTLAMTAIAAYPGDYDQAKAFLAQCGYDDVSIAALDSVRRNHADEIEEIRRDGDLRRALDDAMLFADIISEDRLAIKLRKVALEHVPGYLRNTPAVNPITTIRSLWRLRERDQVAVAAHGPSQPTRKVETSDLMQAAQRLVNLGAAEWTDTKQR